MNPLRSSPLLSQTKKIECVSTHPVESISSVVQSSSFSSCLIITSERLNSLFAKEILMALSKLVPTHLFIVPDGEKAKSIDQAEMCWKAMKQHGLDRRSVVIGLGGGSVTDLAGFVAGTYMRGLDVIYVPTTLLGMVDAAIGGKCGINFQKSKNLIGLFHSPNQVIISLKYLDTLPDAELRSGLAEVIKYGLIADPELFSFIEDEIDAILAKEESSLLKIVRKSTQVKLDFVEKDERDREGIRAFLNFGHTLGHALENVTNYEQFLHGEAIAIGMCFAALISHELGYLESDVVKRLETLLLKVGLPIRLPIEIDKDKLLAQMRGDKKAVEGKINLILINAIGQAFQQNDIDQILILKVLEDIFERKKIPL